MKCAYCKEEINPYMNDNEEPKERTYTVEINGVECEIWVHDECLPKILSEYFSRPREVKPISNNHITIGPDDRDKWWATPQSIPCGGTLNVEQPSQTHVWCKADDESTHSPWKDRVD